MIRQYALDGPLSNLGDTGLNIQITSYFCPKRLLLSEQTVHSNAKAITSWSTLFAKVPMGSIIDGLTRFLLTLQKHLISSDTVKCSKVLNTFLKINVGYQRCLS